MLEGTGRRRWPRDGWGLRLALVPYLASLGMWLVTWPGYRSAFPGTAEYLMYPVVAVLVASILVSPAAAVAALVFGVLDVFRGRREERPLLKWSGLLGILLIVGPGLAVLLSWLYRILLGW